MNCARASSSISKQLEAIGGGSVLTRAQLGTAEVLVEERDQSNQAETVERHYLQLAYRLDATIRLLSDRPGE